MNPLEERLHEYLNQFDDEPWLTPSLRRVVALDHLSQSKKKLVYQGDVPMNTPTPPSPTRVRIYSHVTQSRFLHVEDALAIGKLRLFAGNYRKGQGMDTYAHAFVDIADARVIFGALARGEQSFSHRRSAGKIRNTFDSHSYDDTFRAICDVPLLVLEDLGHENRPPGPRRNCTSFSATELCTGRR